ncbi:MAG: hypothetical protein OZ948_02220 [Deltaproteobacteria bacterium]|nr:hypothetical protein [Deltaproteobacteria bacterium]
MTSYSLRQICELLELDEGLAGELVREAVLVADAPERDRFSPFMLERARVARELVQELEVNVAGAAVIVRLREEIVDLRRAASEIALELERVRRR